MTAKKILVVEDEPDARETLSLLLTLRGCEVAAAADGAAALDLASEFLPDIMLIDISLPVLDGYELAARLRSKPQLRQVLLIATSGYDRDEDKQQAYACGFDAYFVKPIEISALLEYIARDSTNSGA